MLLVRASAAVSETGSYIARSLSMKKASPRVADRSGDGDDAVTVTLIVGQQGGSSRFLRW